MRKSLCVLVGKWVRVCMGVSVCMWVEYSKSKKWERNWETGLEIFSEPFFVGSIISEEVISDWYFSSGHDSGS